MMQFLDPHQGGFFSSEAFPVSSAPYLPVILNREAVKNPVISLCRPWRPDAQGLAPVSHGRFVNRHFERTP